MKVEFQTEKNQLYALLSLLLHFCLACTEKKTDPPATRRSYLKLLKLALDVANVCPRVFNNIYVYALAM